MVGNCASFVHLVRPDFFAAAARVTDRSVGAVTISYTRK